MGNRHPTALLDLKGAYKKNPNRRKPGEPVGESFPADPPDHLNAVEQRHWREVVGLLAHGVLQKSDALIVETLAVLLTEFREDFRKMPSARLTRMGICMGLLGMTPADRTRIQVDKPSEEDDFL